MKRMKIEYLATESLIPYENNPRLNDGAVDAVAASIKEFGFQVPIVIDKRNVIVAGHTRLKAAEKLGLSEVPCVRADELTDEQVKAFRLADNKVSEFAEWDIPKVNIELSDIDIDMSLFGFGQIDTDFFSDREHWDTSRQEGNEEYNEFLEKFEEPKTTDDCYTPDNIYDAVASWVEKKYEVKREAFKRPFYPGGDYQKETYPKNVVVVDNPPFSILTQIVRFYCEHKVKFFLFAPGGSEFVAAECDVSYICASAPILYENGATVRTSFVTNMGEKVIQSAPDLWQAIRDESNKNKQVSTLKKHDYPLNLLTSSMVSYFSAHETEFKISRSQTSDLIRILDSQKEAGAAGIYGSGFLISEKAAAEKAAAEKAAAEKAAAEKAAAEKWELSDREREIVRGLKDDE